MLSKETLERITSVAENSTILALGESKHTSDGLYQAKFEIIRHLIERGQVDCILIENARTKTEKVNSYLKSEVSLEEAMNGLYGVWRSRSMAEFLDWVKLKKEAGYEIKIAGIDNQDPEENLRILEEAGIGWIREEIALLLGETEFKFNGFADLLMERFKSHGQRDQLLNQFYELSDRVLSQDIQGGLKAHLAGESLSSHLRDRATFACGTAEERDDLRVRAYEIRDEAMALIAKQFIQGEKTVLWAHNLHIMKNGKRNNAWPMKTMGDCLDADFGERYKAFALTAYYCDVNWPGNPNETGAPIPHPEGSIEEKVKELGVADRVIDFSKREDELQFGNCRKMFEAIEVEGLKDHFDGILYLEKSPPMEAFDV